MVKNTQAKDSDATSEATLMGQKSITEGTQSQKGDNSWSMNTLQAPSQSKDDQCPIVKREERGIRGKWEPMQRKLRG